jgi:hypothetical protein
MTCMYPPPLLTCNLPHVSSSSYDMHVSSSFTDMQSASHVRCQRRATEQIKKPWRRTTLPCTNPAAARETASGWGPSHVLRFIAGSSARPASRGMKYMYPPPHMTLLDLRQGVRLRQPEPAKAAPLDVALQRPELQRQPAKAAPLDVALLFFVHGPLDVALLRSWGRCARRWRPGSAEFFGVSEMPVSRRHRYL